MDKKYQIFISSTYKDLIPEREKVRDVILSMYQFPIGMEMFSAANEEQWEIIKETIDSSDYYVLIIGKRYGSVIEEGPDKGISYTEKEYRYAKEIGLPILAYIKKDEVITADNVDDDPEKIKKLQAFKSDIINGREVKWFNTVDQLGTEVTLSLHKEMDRKKRPGWVRGDSFDLEASLNELLMLNKRVRELEEENKKLKENEVQRRPSLCVYIQFTGTLYEPIETMESNAEETDSDEFKTSETVQRVQINNSGYYESVEKLKAEDIPEDLREIVTPEIIADYNSKLPDKETIAEYERQMHLYNEVCKNGQLLDFIILNDGTARATDVNVSLEFPESFLIMKRSEAKKLHKPMKPRIPSNPIETARMQMSVAEKTGDTLKQMLKLMGDSYEGLGFRSLDNHNPFSDVPVIIDEDHTVNWSLDIEENTVTIWSKDLLHTYTQVADNLCIIPMKKGTFKIKTTIMCEEYIMPEKSELEIIVE